MERCCRHDCPLARSGLKKIAQEHPTACLRAGALMAVLSFLDLFSTGVQRVALSTAAKMCKKLPSDAADFVMEVVQLALSSAGAMCTMEKTALPNRSYRP